MPQIREGVRSQRTTARSAAVVASRRARRREQQLVTIRFGSGVCDVTRAYEREGGAVESSASSSLQLGDAGDFKYSTDGVGVHIRLYRADGAPPADASAAAAPY
eukprot:SAG31_NODE_610_length_13564_cov_3.189528_9_plen_104_part_00